MERIKHALKVLPENDRDLHSLVLFLSCDDEKINKEREITLQYAIQNILDQMIEDGIVDKKVKTIKTATEEGIINIKYEIFSLVDEE